jgi:hypothetical protein
VGTDEALRTLRDLNFVQRDGTTATWRCYGSTYETGRAAKKRAR